ncbi:MAG: alpha/beta fold hydrolase [Elusimicrobia bacterium]|nr:alpha/beta fold hydrolase [Elusimicrobiota bacterium]
MKRAAASSLLGLLLACPARAAEEHGTTARSLASSSARAFAAEAPKRKPIRQLPGEEIQLLSKDGWTLTGTYQAAGSSKPVCILLHGGAGRRQDWYSLAWRMARRGFGYVAFDFRGHGQSQNPPPNQPAQWNKFVINKSYNEWDNMREDIAAAAEFLKAKGVPAELLSLGGSDVGANIALKYAAVHPEVPSVFLLSPSLNYREVLTVNAIRKYKDRPIPILIVTAEDDKRFTTEARLLYNIAKQSVGEERATLLESPRGHGTKIFGSDKELAVQILDWLEDPAAFAAKDQIEESTEEEKPAEGDGLPSESDLEQAYEKLKGPDLSQ